MNPVQSGHCGQQDRRLRSSNSLQPWISVPSLRNECLTELLKDGRKSDAWLLLQRIQKRARLDRPDHLTSLQNGPTANSRVRWSGRSMRSAPSSLSISHAASKTSRYRAYIGRTFRHCASSTPADRLRSIVPPTSTSSRVRPSPSWQNSV